MSWPLAALRVVVYTNQGADMMPLKLIDTNPRRSPAMIATDRRWSMTEAPGLSWGPGFVRHPEELLQFRCVVICACRNNTCDFNSVYFLISAITWVEVTLCETQFVLFAGNSGSPTLTRQRRPTTNDNGFPGYLTLPPPPWRHITMVVHLPLFKLAALFVRHISKYGAVCLSLSLPSPRQ